MGSTLQLTSLVHNVNPVLIVVVVVVANRIQLRADHLPDFAGSLADLTLLKSPAEHFICLAERKQVLFSLDLLFDIFLVALGNQTSTSEVAAFE